jgi:hypothetical protein
MNISKETVALSKRSATANRLLAILLATSLVALLMPVGISRAYAEPGAGGTTELLLPDYVDDPIRALLTFGQRGLDSLQISDYSSKYLDYDASTGRNKTVRDWLLGDGSGSDNLVEFAESTASLMIAGDLDATIFEYFDLALASNASVSNNLNKVIINTTENIPQSEIDFWTSAGATPAIKALFNNIDFDFTLPNTPINHVYIDLLNSLNPHSLVTNWGGRQKSQLSLILVPGPVAAL